MQAAPFRAMDRGLAALSRGVRGGGPERGAGRPERMT